MSPYRSLFRWIALSVLSPCLSIGLTWWAHEGLGWSPRVAFACALAVVYVTNFLLCRYFVFAASSQPFRRQFAGFLTASLLFRGFEYLLFVMLLEFTNLNYLIAIVLALLLTSAVKFIVYRNYLFNMGDRA